MPLTGMKAVSPPQSSGIRLRAASCSWAFCGLASGRSILVIATTIGVVLSFCRPVRRLEAVGASRLATVFLYLLVATIGLKMDLLSIGQRPGLFAIGFVWISIQAIFVLGTAILLRAPIFFAAVGSQANIGGAASAPVVAAAFDPRLAPVGVLLAVVGYALGTYGAWLAAQLMRVAAGG